MFELGRSVHLTRLLKNSCVSYDRNTEMPFSGVASLRNKSVIELRFSEGLPSSFVIKSLISSGFALEGAVIGTIFPEN